MRNTAKLTASLVALLAGGTALGQDENIIFNGTVNATCTISGVNNGTLGVNGTTTVLDSTETGGAAGTATVTTTGTNFTIEVVAPAAFTTSPAGTPAATFATTYDATGATTAAGVGGATTTPLGNGTTNLSVDASATSGGGAFPAGNYSLTAIIRCTAA